MLQFPVPPHDTTTALAGPPRLSVLMPGICLACCHVPFTRLTRNIPVQLGFVYDPTAVQLPTEGQEIDLTLEKGRLPSRTVMPGTGSGACQPCVPAWPAGGRMVACAVLVPGTTPSRSTPPATPAQSQARRLTGIT